MMTKLKQIVVPSTTATDMVLKTDSSGKLKLTHEVAAVGTTYPSSPVNGQLFYNSTNGYLCAYDSTRSKWLSVERHIHHAGLATVTRTTSYYFATDNATHSSANGIFMPYNGTIVGATLSSGTTNGTVARVFEIRVNNSTTNKVSLSLVSSATVYSNSFNLDFSAGNLIQIYSASVGGTGTTLSNVLITFTVAWR